jgi:hypothetical protein
MHDTAARDMARLYSDLDRHLGEQPFLAGDFSIADIAVSPHVMAATFLGFAPDPSQHTRLARWADRVQQRPSIVRDNADVIETLQRLQGEQKQAFDPFRVQWRSDRLEWVIKNGFAEWFAAETKAGRTFFPLPVSS